jgi:CheY-like chemotaxis protein
VLDSDRKRCFAAGMDEVLAKPIEPSELRRTLSERLATQDPSGALIEGHVDDLEREAFRRQ